MSDFIMAAQNGREIPKEDVIFGISRRANEMIAEVGDENVVNATIGALLDDDGDLMVLSSVDDTFMGLEPVEYAQYAPIGGTPAFRTAAIKAALRSYVPKGQVRAVATPGGTGSIRNTVSNYSCPGDQILTTDWFWGPYKTIAQELGRTLTTFKLFDDNRKFNIEDFSKRVKEILANQDRLVIIINTPAQNPTGYSLTVEDWKGVSGFLADLPPEKRVALLVDTAYIDFAGDEDEYRKFLPILETLPANVLPIIAFSMSKTFTLYGLRCGAMICLAPNEAIADEFVRVCEFSARGTWSNSPKAGQSIIANIYADPDLLQRVSDERTEIRNMLLERGHAFEEEAAKVGLIILPYDAGFFASIPCDDPAAISAKLEKEGVFLVPLAKGLRVSVASISADKCRMLPAKIKKAME